MPFDKCSLVLETKRGTDDVTIIVVEPHSFGRKDDRWCPPTVKETLGVQSSFPSKIPADNETLTTEVEDEGRLGSFVSTDKGVLIPGFPTEPLKKKREREKT